MSQDPTFTVVKSAVELYKIRPDSGCCWADITIDAHGTVGRISIASDYGNWQNYWGACGSDFKKFLSRINEDYAADKFGAEPRIDVDASAKMWRAAVIDHRRQCDITAELARDIWDEIDGLSLYGHKDIEAELLQSTYLIDFLRDWSDYDWFDHEPNPQFLRFWKELWPVLLAEFANERQPTHIPT